MSNDNSRGRGVSVTIKCGKGFEETWQVFIGSPEEVREDIISYFGLDRESVAALTVYEVVTIATEQAHAVANVATKLGATPIAVNNTVTAPANDPWAGVEGTPAGQPAQPEGPNPILAQIEACTSVEELTRLWAENQSAFGDAAVMAAYKNKGRSLQAAA